MCVLPSESVALICHTPLLNDLVDKLKCHAPAAASVRRNSLPVVAASVGVSNPCGPADQCRNDRRAVSSVETQRRWRTLQVVERVPIGFNIYDPSVVCSRLATPQTLEAQIAYALRS